jgi:hypothetical protein
MVSFIAWIAGLAIVGAEIALFVYAGRALWRRRTTARTTVRQFLLRLTLPGRVLVLLLAGAGALLAMSDFFLSRGTPDGSQVAAVVTVWTAFALSILIAADLGGQAAWRSLRRRFAKRSW